MPSLSQLSPLARVAKARRLVDATIAIVAIAGMCWFGLVLRAKARHSATTPDRPMAEQARAATPTTHGATGFQKH